MIIKKILLKNFKFHHDLQFKINKQNCLVYGENGSGKSSIYEALYTSLYDPKMRGKQIDFWEKYKHRDYSAEDMLVNIKFSGEDQLIRNNNSLENSNLISDQTVYCANERLLREISEHDFYYVINSILLEHFPAINSINKIYSTLSREIKRYNHTQQEKQDKEKIVTQRIECDSNLRKEIDTIIPVVKINKILKEKLNESFQIAFEVKDSSIDFSAIDIRLIYPKIKIRLKNISHRGELKDNFNEAKLKLISIAIYFQQFPLTEKLFYNHSFEKTTTVQIKKGILTDYA